MLGTRRAVDYLLPVYESSQFREAASIAIFLNMSQARYPTSASTRSSNTNAFGRGSKDLDLLTNLPDYEPSKPMDLVTVRFLSLYKYLNDSPTSLIELRNPILECCTPTESPVIQLIVPLIAPEVG